MQPQRRVSLPAPARTTRMNGGPRLRAGTPLPPYRPSVAVREAPTANTLNPPHIPETAVSEVSSYDAVTETPDVKSASYAPVTDARDGQSLEDDAGMAAVPREPSTDDPRPYVPPAIVEERPTFPMDAFIIPEGTARLPCGVGEPAVGTATTGEQEPTDSQPAASRTDVRAPDLVDTAPLPVRESQDRRPRSASMREQRAHDVADRLEALATQLRDHGYEVLAQRSVRGDALDALLAGVIAGYLVAAE